MQQAQSETTEEIRKHLAPWRQILLEIVDQVEQERKMMPPRRQETTGRLSKEKSRTRASE
jgi:hypothetical protein